jgi:hypothetical protein
MPHKIRVVPVRFIYKAIYLLLFLLQIVSGTLHLLCKDTLFYNILFILLEIVTQLLLFKYSDIILSTLR